MRGNATSRKGPLLLGIAAGLAVFAAGALLAAGLLPEWDGGQRPAPEAVFRDRFRELASRGGLRLVPGEPRVYLSTRGQELARLCLLGDGGLDWLRETKTAVRVEVSQPARAPWSRKTGRLVIDFSLDGLPQTLTWWEPGAFENRVSATARERAGTLAAVLLAPGESLGPPVEDHLFNLPQILYPLTGCDPPQHIHMLLSEAVVASRLPDAPTAANLAVSEAFLRQAFSLFWISAAAFAAVVGLFLVLLLQSRLSVANGAVLALLALLTLPPLPDSRFALWTWSIVATLGFTAWIFFLWSAAESLLRSTSREFTTSLDALSAGRLGPRGGRALVLGFAFGAGLAGLRLGLHSLAATLPGVWPKRPSVGIPVFAAYGSPLADGLSLAGAVALALALATRLLPLRWAPVAAALVIAAAGPLLLPDLVIHPYPVALAAGAAVAGLLVHVCRRHGLTALLTTAVVSFLLPATLAASLHPRWMPGTLAAAAGLSLALPLLGLLGLGRPAAAEVERLAPPAFVRRLDEERRLKNEMGLLARMQRGLLPKTLPRVPGWEVAARSEIANEAGGDLYDFLADDEGFLWIAAGDVAGHGYSCAIAQAMTKAALASLTGRGRTPAEVLHRADRVLRAAGGPTRNFTSLALLRLRPETGEALLANAGHPYPLLAAGGEVSEIALPGLPLGQGPARRYADHAFVLPPGGVLVFGSDGLFEAMDSNGAPYGFDRVRAVLRVAAGRPSGKILEALLADWQRHLGPQKSLDDTTLVVLRREPA